MRRILCYKIGKGYLAQKQVPKSIFLTYTEDPVEAKTYKTKQTAARAFGMRRWDSEYASEVLRFFEVEVPEAKIQVDTIQAV